MSIPRFAALCCLPAIMLPGAEFALAGEAIFEPFELYPIQGGTPAVAVGHLNDDDRMDLATADGCNGICPLVIFLQQPDGTFAPSQEFDLFEQDSIAIGDLNGDGMNDVIGPQGSSVAILYQASPGVFDNPILLQASPPSRRVLVGDFNNDGLDDAVALPWGSGTDAVDLYTQQPDGSLAWTVFQVEHHGFDDLEGGDLNGDGRDDLVIASSQGPTTENVAVVLQGDNGLDPPIYYDLGMPMTTDCLAVADVTGDGLDDLVIDIGFGAPNQVGILIQTPQGDLTPGPLSPGPGSIRGCAAADLNYDGFADLALIGPGSDVEILLGRVSGAFVSGGTYAVPSMNGDRHGVRLADIDRNGSIDLIVAADNDGVVVLRNRLHRLFSDGFESGDTSAWSAAVP